MFVRAFLLASGSLATSEVGPTCYKGLYATNTSKARQNIFCGSIKRANNWTLLRSIDLIDIDVVYHRQWR